VTDFMIRSTSHYVIATAGHVDHGKSTLVRALTGIDPDRLAEEKAREMTIDLGYAWLEQPDGTILSIVDVPGHERFIKNMLAGVGGIDAALLVIASDEEFMPQTEEHLAILDLLKIERGVVALTKSDLVDDEWLAYVSEEVRERLIGTHLATAPIVPVSAVTGQGLESLIAELSTQLAQSTLRTDLGMARLSIDRTFTVAGYGTVVTGTLVDGSLSIGDELVIHPGETPVRVRGLQMHNRPVERAEPGNRVAVNLAGVSVDSLRRGDVLARKGTLTPSLRIDVSLSLLGTAPTSLKQDDQIDFFLAAEEAPAWVTLLDRDELAPSESGWVQLRFRSPVVAKWGDRFIIRRPSPSETIGGGVIVDPNPVRHRRFDDEVIAGLETRLAGDPDQRLLLAIGRTFHPIASLAANNSDMLERIDRLVEAGTLIRFGPNQAFVAHVPFFNEIKQQLLNELRLFHEEYPYLSGIPRQEIRTRLGLGKEFDALISAFVNHDVLADDGATIRLASFTISIDSNVRAAADRWIAAINEHPFAPPAPADFGLAREDLIALTELGEIINAGEGIYVTPAALAVVEARVLAAIDQDGSIDLATYRDLVQTSRKYAQAMLELLDQRRVTRRVGDRRVRYRSAGQPVQGDVS
jgi:selenocysteine-specific elongation factor